MCSSPGVCGDTCRPNQTSRGTPLRGTLSQRRIVFGSPCLRTTMASRSAHCRHRRRSHSDRRIREALLSAQCVGRNAESCAFVDVSHGPGSGAHEMVERIDGQKCEPDHGPDRAAVLARRVVGSLPARLQSTQPDRGVYRTQPGFRRAGVLRGALALVQCRLAGETACPTKTCQSTGQNVETPGADRKVGGRAEALAPLLMKGSQRSNSTEVASAATPFAGLYCTVTRRGFFCT